MKINKLSAYGLGAFVVTFGATLAFGQARVPYTRPPYITTPGAVTAGSVSSTGPISVAAGQNLCLDGPACLTRFNYNSGVNNLDYFQNNAVRLAVTPGGSVQAQVGFNANVASGAYGYACTNVGCRIHLGNTGRYLDDNGSRINSSTSFGAPVFTNNAFNTAILRGTREDSAFSVGVFIENSFSLTTEGAKLVSFRNPNVEVAFIDKDGDFSAPTYTATATSGSSFTGGNASTTMTLTSNTTDAVTSSTVPAIRLQSGQNITDSDLLLSIEDSAGIRRVTVTESGLLTGSNSVFTNVSSERFQQGADAVTINDNGVGGSAATLSWTPAKLSGEVTCNDADGCELNVTTTGTLLGHALTIMNVGTNTVTVIETSGTIEMAGNFAMGQWDTIQLIRRSDRWVETNRSNN